MDKAAYIEYLEAGVEFWNKWRNDNPDIKPDLSNIDFKGFDLSCYNLSNCDLSGANARNSDLSHVDFNYSNLSEVYFHKSNFYMANFSNCIIENATMMDGHFQRSIFDFSKLKNVDFSHSEFYKIKFKNSIFDDVNFSYTHMIDCSFQNAEIRNCKVYGLSAWDLNLINTYQTNLIINSPSQSFISVDNIEVAQFIYLLLNNQKIRSVIDTITSKIVLILGRFSDERKVILDEIKSQLSQRNYTPVLFDFIKPDNLDISETVSVLARLSKFVIADLTDPKCLPHELQEFVPNHDVPVKPIALVSEKIYSMFFDLKRKYHWVLEPFYYKDISDIITSFDESIILEAERKVEEIRKSKAIVN